MPEERQGFTAWNHSLWRGVMKSNGSRLEHDLN